MNRNQNNDYRFFSRSDLSDKNFLINDKRLRRIWFAGGCFWGIEAYFSRIEGVIETSVGYANGNSDNPSYEEISRTGHAETVEILYNSALLNLENLIEYFLEVIDPTSLNRQGNDIGKQYRTGIYYEDATDENIIFSVLEEKQKCYNKPFMIEVKPLDNFYPAEAYHQKYLEKNPGGYCHIDLTRTPHKIKAKCKNYIKPDQEKIKKILTPLAYSVTQENDTEPPFQNEYWDNHKAGIYVDTVTGEPLFLSIDKFDSGTGWPSFTRPIRDDVISIHEDKSFAMIRKEVKSSIGNSHLGHLFSDGPQNKGGLRYCINSASLRFIPYEKMEEEGYGEYLKTINKIAD